MQSGERRRLIESAFEERYGDSPTRWVRAPGRVDLMGSHTDYNRGRVLTLAIDRDTWIAARTREDDQVRLHSLNLGADADVGWALYVHGVLRTLESAGYASPGFDAIFHGTIPLASGLSSSASLECATARLVEALGGHGISGLELAQLCQRAENEVVGVPCGILDQYTSLMGASGHAIVLDCETLTHELAAIDASLAIVVADTRAPRPLADSAYDERRSSCEAGLAELRRHRPLASLCSLTPSEFDALGAALPAPVEARCRFVIEENARVPAMADALSHGDRTSIESLCDASFRGARDLYEICVPEMEAMIAALREAPGIIGARQTGAGFGGCMVAIVERSGLDDCMSTATSLYRERSGRPGVLFEIHSASAAGPI